MVADIAMKNGIAHERKSSCTLPKCRWSYDRLPYSQLYFTNLCVCMLGHIYNSGSEDMDPKQQQNNPLLNKSQYFLAPKSNCKRSAHQLTNVCCKVQHRTAIALLNFKVL